MPLHNPHRAYDKGMEDAYMGREPQSDSSQYMQGYERALQLDEYFEDEKSDFIFEERKDRIRKRNTK